MNKKLTSILALALTLVIVFSLAACSEVEYGSKVQKMNMVLSYADADGNTVERTVKIKLYENLAPKTVAHFIDLAQKGYYDGTVVSNLQSGWFEIGGYKSVNGVFEACDKDVATVEGEFSVNGWLNNPLKSSNVGALIMKRNYSLDTDAVHPYDTAKATVIVTTASASKFNSTEYCYFGLVVSDDDNYVVTSADTEYKKTSLDACKALADYRVKDGAIVYYYELTGEYYMIVTTTDEEGTNTSYYKGTTVSEENLLEGDELEEFSKIRNDSQKNCFLLTVPYTTITIKSIRKA